MIQRIAQEKIQKTLFKGKIVMLIGSRQVGKTTLATQILNLHPDQSKTLYLRGDDIGDLNRLQNQSLGYHKLLFENYELILIDEAQKIDKIATTLKLLVDFFKDKKQFIVTGSSAFDLLNSVSEALTGRKRVFYLYPLSVAELIPNLDQYKIESSLESLLVYGSYPEVWQENDLNQKIIALKEIGSSYLYKDILEFQNLQNPSQLLSLLQHLAYQVGGEVSYNEIGQKLGIDSRTVERYVDLLEKNFVVFRLPSFSKNKRKELSKSRKVYFYDLGIRNYLIGEYKSLSDRNDIGALWENFVIVERLKHREYKQIEATQYFWKTYGGAEIDLVEEIEGKLNGYEIKWNPKKQPKPPESWLVYPNSTYDIINPMTLRRLIK